MRTEKTIETVREFVTDAKRSGKTVGYVATMGFLHEGHMSLVDTARAENDIVVVSVFVNPLQFGPNEDFEAYPRDLNHDAELLDRHHCDLLFAPSAKEMYPAESLTFVQVDKLGEGLCGKTRPIHFRGVTTVVSKLLNIVQPDKAYFGQKDGQQLAIIRRMVKDLNTPVEIVGVPIVREEDGLARSSRNIYLTPEVRPHATILYRTLEWAKAEIETGERNAEKLLKEMNRRLNAEPFVKVDYVEAVDMETLQPVSILKGDIMVAIAAYVGKARLIDNIQIHVA
jgi:pantoate--beta-alanine ligase